MNPNHFILVTVELNGKRSFDLVSRHATLDEARAAKSALDSGSVGPAKRSGILANRHPSSTPPSLGLWTSLKVVEGDRSFVEHANAELAVRG